MARWTLLAAAVALCAAPALLPPACMGVAHAQSDPEITDCLFTFDNEYCIYCGGTMRKTCLAGGTKCTAYYWDAESSESKGVELEMCDTFSPSGDQPSGNCYASITVDGQAFSLIPDGSSSSPPSETVTECGDSGGGTSPPPTTGTTATNTGSCFPEGFYTNQKSWLGLDGVECESEQLDADKALAGSQKWLDSLGVGSVCQWKVDDWAAACDCVKTEKAAVDAGGTVCQECTKTLYESTLTQECRKALTEVQCTNFTPEQIATLQSQLGADKAAEVAARAKFGVGIKAFFDQCQISY